MATLQVFCVETRQSERYCVGNSSPFAELVDNVKAGLLAYGNLKVAIPTGHPHPTQPTLTQDNHIVGIFKFSASGAAEPLCPIQRFGLPRFYNVVTKLQPDSAILPQETIDSALITPLTSVAQEVATIKSKTEVKDARIVIITPYVPKVDDSFRQLLSELQALKIQLQVDLVDLSVFAASMDDSTDDSVGPIVSVGLLARQFPLFSISKYTSSRTDCERNIKLHLRDLLDQYLPEVKLSVGDVTFTASICSQLLVNLVEKTCACHHIPCVEAFSETHCLLQPGLRRSPPSVSLVAAHRISIGFVLDFHINGPPIWLEPSQSDPNLRCLISQLEDSKEAIIMTTDFHFESLSPCAKESRLTYIATPHGGYLALRLAISTRETLLPLHRQSNLSQPSAEFQAVTRLALSQLPVRAHLESDSVYHTSVNSVISRVKTGKHPPAPAHSHSAPKLNSHQNGKLTATSADQSKPKARPPAGNKKPGTLPPPSSLTPLPLPKRTPPPDFSRAPKK